jgi:hypothetical protein
VARITRYDRHERLEVRNIGQGVAENVRLAVAVRAGVSGRIPTIALPDAPIARFAPGGAFDVPLIRTFGTASPFELTITWEEDGVEYESQHSIV